MQEALELQAERRHAFVLDNVYAEASSYISRLEASADETHRQQLSFVRQSTEVKVLVGQLNRENRVFRQIAEAEKKDQWPCSLVHNTPKHKHLHAHSQPKTDSTNTREPNCVLRSIKTELR